MKVRLSQSYIALILTFTLIIIQCSNQESGISGNIDQFTLSNGMQVVLKENHSSSMITSLIFVKAGSKYENEYNNGVTHLLEHLLFGGTGTQTQAEITEGIERLGGYINAFTRKDFTAYLVLMPKEYIDYGLTTQADMLFNSTIPEENLPKERKIVIEEIKMGADAEGSSAEDFFAASAYEGTSYAHPIIGYESIIANIPREAVVDYYRRFYAPNNMMALLIGDFDSGEMKESMERIFEQFGSVELPPTTDIPDKKLTGKQIFRTSANAKSTYINFSISGPHYSDDGFFAYNLIADYLSDTENSPLNVVLRRGENPMVDEISVYLDVWEEMTRLNIGIVTDQTSLTDSIVYLTDIIISGLSAAPPSSDLLEGYKVSRRCEEIYLREKLHYYGFVKAPLLATTGWDFFNAMPDNMDSVTLEGFILTAQKYFDEPGYVATVVSPASINETRIQAEWGPNETSVKDYFARIEYEEYELGSLTSFEMSQPAEVEGGSIGHASYLSETLSNGLKIIVKSNPDSRVFAVNVIGLNRSANEPRSKTGVTDFVNRMIGRGTVHKDANTLSKELTKIGAQVTLYDNPWIPYDDKYTSRRYSFMKFETIDQYTEEGIDLFAEMITRPAFDSIEVGKVRQELYGLLGRKSGSTYKKARDEFYATLFKETAYAKTVEGTYRTVGTITMDDLKNHYARMYSPENMIITVGTNDSPERIMTLMKDAFGGMASTGFETMEAEKPRDIRGIVKAHEQMDKEQVYIYLGHLLPSVHDTDAAALKVAGEILSTRLRNVLRETRGLAYSVGASANLDKNFGWLMASIGTAGKNFDDARNGIIEIIESMKNTPPTPEELEMAVNSIWGSYLISNLSRINQVYYMGVYEQLGLGYNFGEQYIRNIRQVTPEQVTQVSRKYFDTENYVLASAGNK